MAPAVTPTTPLNGAGVGNEGGFATRRTKVAPLRTEKDAAFLPRSFSVSGIEYRFAKIVDRV